MRIPKYFCKNCGFKNVFQVSRFNDFIGYATLVTIRCKECGEQVNLSKDVIGAVCSKHLNKNRYTVHNNK